MNSESQNWSNESQAHTQICILESQIGVKDSTIETLRAEMELLKQENARLNSLVSKLTIMGKCE